MALLLLLFGCLSMIVPKHQKLDFDELPPGTTVKGGDVVDSAPGMLRVAVERPPFRNSPDMTQVMSPSGTLAVAAQPDAYLLFEAPGHCSQYTRLEGQVAPARMTISAMQLLMIPIGTISAVKDLNADPSPLMRYRSARPSLVPCENPWARADPEQTTLHFSSQEKGHVFGMISVSQSSTGSTTTTTLRYVDLGSTPLDVVVPNGQTPHLMFARRNRPSMFAMGDPLHIPADGVEKDIRVKNPSPGGIVMGSMLIGFAGTGLLIGGLFTALDVGERGPMLGLTAGSALVTVGGVAMVKNSSTHLDIQPHVSQTRTPQP